MDAAQTEFPPLGKVLRGKKGRFDQFGDAVLERSSRAAVGGSDSQLDRYRLVGFVDNEAWSPATAAGCSIAGSSTDGRCIDEQILPAPARRRAVIDIGRAAGIDMVFSMSPDKSTIYPEALNATVRGYWKCRARSSAALRRAHRPRAAGPHRSYGALARGEGAPSRHSALLTRRTRTGPRYGGAIALRQLLAALYPERSIPPGACRCYRGREHDLAAMLLLPIEEQGPVAEPLLAPGSRLPGRSAQSIRP
jgi:hypothetical protein